MVLLSFGAIASGVVISDYDYCRDPNETELIEMSRDGRNFARTGNGPGDGGMSTLAELQYHHRFLVEERKEWITALLPERYQYKMKTADQLDDEQ